MVRKIWKYRLELQDDVQIFDMPENARLVHVTMQDKYPCMWFEVNPQKDVEKRGFRIFATGQIVEPVFTTYRGTCVDNDLMLVWHIYELDGLTVLQEYGDD